MSTPIGYINEARLRAMLATKPGGRHLGQVPVYLAPPSEPTWWDGAPTNLAAAAMDALEWLRYLRDRPTGLPAGSENRKRVADAAAALERFLTPTLGRGD